jgi:alkanesulfonate monooxygenase SsuD/methylene tetrahydromethanopterin reductase-like flavin-dependent oxidoreductase (luciferase family)
MKICALIQTPLRELPADFEQRYVSAVTSPFWELTTPEKVRECYRWTLDELTAAAKAGFDGVVMTEHSQNTYDMMPNPNLIMSQLALQTEGLDNALIVLGTSVGKSHQPVRIAEEYALLDCLSGGRLIAGLPLGLGYDAGLNYGVPPIELRGRYREAHDLIVKAWSAREPFPWNGKYWKLPSVNIWPRPIQQPMPIVWVPGSGTPGTINRVLDNNYGYVLLSWFGPLLGGRIPLDRFWSIVADRGLPANPSRLAFLQNVVVSESDSQAERDYAEHVEFFFHKCLGRIPPHWLTPPGYIDYFGMEQFFKDPREVELAASWGTMGYRDFVDKKIVIGGSPATVRDQLKEMVRELRIGNLLLMVQMGSMPHDLVLKNIDLLAREVLPALRDTWDDEGWEHEWWPQSLRARQPALATSAV